MTTYVYQLTDGRQVPALWYEGFTEPHPSHGPWGVDKLEGVGESYACVGCGLPAAGLAGAAHPCEAVKAAGAWIKLEGTP